MSDSKHGVRMLKHQATPAELLRDYAATVTATISAWAGTR